MSVSFPFHVLRKPVVTDKKQIPLDCVCEERPGSVPASPLAFVVEHRAIKFEFQRRSDFVLIHDIGRRGIPKSR